LYTHPFIQFTIYVPIISFLLLPCSCIISSPSVSIKLKALEIKNAVTKGLKGACSQSKEAGVEDRTDREQTREKRSKSTTVSKKVRVKQGKRVLKARAVWEEDIIKIIRN
jgi:hypothetical protein